MPHFSSSQVRSIFVCCNSQGYSEAWCIKGSFWFIMTGAGRSRSAVAKRSKWAQYLTTETSGFFLPQQIPGCSSKAATKGQVCMPKATSTASTLHCLHALITWGNPHHFQSSLNYPWLCADQESPDRWTSPCGLSKTHLPCVKTWLANICTWSSDFFIQDLGLLPQFIKE